MHYRNITIGAAVACRLASAIAIIYAQIEMSPTWIWMQIAIVVFVLIGMVVAITKLA